MNIKKELVKAKSEVIGVHVKNAAKENLGVIHEIVLDKISGQTVYLVLETPGFLGLNGKLFAIPWHAIHYDLNEECFMLNVDKQKLKSALGFDRENWPNIADPSWSQSIEQYYADIKSDVEDQ